VSNFLYDNPDDDALDLEYQLSVNACRSEDFEASDPRTMLEKIFSRTIFEGPRNLRQEELDQWNSAPPGDEQIRSQRLYFYWITDHKNVFHLRLVNPWQKNLPAFFEQFPDKNTKFGFFSLSKNEFEWARKKSFLLSRLNLHWLAQPLTSATSDSLWLTLGHVIDDHEAFHAGLHFALPVVVSVIAGLVQYQCLRIRYQQRFGHQPDDTTSRELMRKCAAMAFISTVASMGWLAGFMIARMVVLACAFTPQGLMAHLTLALSAALCQAVFTVGVTLLMEHRNGGISSTPKDIAKLFLSSFASAAIWYSFTLINIPIPWVKYTVASIVSFVVSTVVYTLLSAPHKIMEELSHVGHFTRLTPKKDQETQAEPSAYNSGFFGKTLNKTPKSTPEKDKNPQKFNFGTRRFSFNSK
jgi:hypothetical protein